MKIYRNYCKKGLLSWWIRKRNFKENQTYNILSS